MDKFLIAFIALITYAIFILIAKKIGLGRKTQCGTCNNCCPDCESPLNRIPRKSTDHLIHHVTFRAFNSRRYICTNCGWEGLRWENAFKNN